MQTTTKTEQFFAERRSTLPETITAISLPGQPGKANTVFTPVTDPIISGSAVKRRKTSPSVHMNPMDSMPVRKVLGPRLEARLVASLMCCAN